MEGRILGTDDGLVVGGKAGCTEGVRLIGASPMVGRVGMLVGKEIVCTIDGEAVGSLVGFEVGTINGWLVGCSMGCHVGF